MRLAPDQLVRLARLSDDGLELAGDARAAWLASASRAHPDLAEALAVMAAATPHAGGSGEAGGRTDPLSLPAIGATAQAGALDLGDEHRAGDRIGPYRLRSLLGRGGMGAVWLAEQVDGRLHRSVALKLPLPGRTDANWRRRFERERDILAALDHPGIAKLFDAGLADDGQPYLAMQYVAGETLTQHARTQGLGLAARVRLFVQLLEVVQHAHAALVVHRDLKPGNILVDEQGRVMLLDFGIAKLLPVDAPQGEAGVTEFAGSALTLDYASPEQVSGEAIGTGTDVYSLGVVLYELLAGQRPYRLRRASRAAMEEAVLEQELAPPSGRVAAAQAASTGSSVRALARQLRGDLDAIVLKSLRKKSDQRYATAQAFAEDLQRWLRKEPVSAQPDALGYRLRRMLVRRWQLFAIGTALGAVLMGATVVAVLQAREARQASELARDKARQAEAVTAFLQDLFLGNGVRQLDPAAARKRTAEQLMDDAASRIGTALAEAPEQQVAMLDRMARMYFEMRLVDRGAALARQASELAARAFGPDDPTTRSEQALWLTMSASNGHNEAFDTQLRPLVQRLPVLARSTREDERKLALDLCVAVMNRDFEMRPESALDCATLLEPLLAKDGGGAGAHHMMGVVYLENLRLADAARHFDITRRIEAEWPVAANGDESFPTWQGRLQALTGHYAQAETLMQAGYRMERHNDAGESRVNDWGLAAYARFLADTGRPADGLALATTGGDLASPAIRQQLGNSLRSVLARAHALARLGRSDEALAAAALGEQLLRREAGTDLPPPTDALDALLMSGQADQAIAILDREEPRFVQGRASIAARQLSEYRVRGLTALGRVRDARDYLESRRAILLPDGAGPAEAARLAWLDAGVTLLEGRPADARRVLDDGLQRLAQAGPEAAPYLREWNARLLAREGDAARAMGDAAGARTAWEAALADYAGVVDPRYSMALARVATQLAALARERHDVVAAKRLSAQADAIVARHVQQKGWGA